MRTSRERTLVEGLTDEERIALLETAVPALWRANEQLLRRIEDLESALRRLQMPWDLRWFVNRKNP